ncbi:substrate-binding domain-containing protein [Nocardioides sp. CN2-186]|uniref:substrate-binding domain-containing protein n=1 Tax=Nocardioides tweenelious TaxID=3156607 RepID=UPI0032B3EC6D
MNRRLASAIAVVGLTSTLAIAGAGVATADPVPGSPGTPPPGKTAAQIYSTVGADAFAELTNNLTLKYNAQTPAPDHTLASYDAINPDTGAAGENITTKPGCSVARPNGANAGITAITLNQKSTVDPSQYCIDWVRSSRAKGTAASEANLTFYAQSRDAVSYAVIGNAYAPTTPLTAAQLKDIFECTTQDWSEVGGQAGPIHVYLPPASAATLTFFLQAIGTTLNNVNAGCAGLPTVFSQQQNDGRTLNGDPQGIAPYAVTKWAAQVNEPVGIKDYRGGTHIGLVNTTTPPVTTKVLNGVSYEVLNPDFTTGASAAFGRIFFNTVRNDAPDSLKAIFKDTGYLCANADQLLIPFGNTPLGNDHTASRYCGQAS